MAAPIQAPSVTMEDLQAFQTLHFPGYAKEPAINGLLTTSRDGGFDADDDGLGYYSDGVKRTLTDQEIEIFRHSEIQSLLRDQRIKEDARLERMDEELLDDAGNLDAGGDLQKQEVDKVEEPGPVEPGKGKRKNTDTERITVDGKKQNMGSGIGSTAALDYDEEPSTAAEPDKPLSQPPAPFMGRKMVSYGDDDA